MKPKLRLKRLIGHKVIGVLVWHRKGLYTLAGYPRGLEGS